MSYGKRIDTLCSLLEKAEMFAETIKQLTADAPIEIKSTILRLKMAVQKEDYNKAFAAFEVLKENYQQQD